MPKKSQTPFTYHALERIRERYGIHLTKKRQQTFSRTLSNPKWTIRLTDHRRACYFEGNWYLLVCTESTHPEPSCSQSSYSASSPIMAIQTFLRLEDANDDDKLILRNDKKYLKINNDAFHVFSMPLKPTEPLPTRSIKTVKLPDLADDELPHNEIQLAERVLNRFCDGK